MNVQVNLSNNRSHVFEDAQFSVGLSILVDKVTNSGTIVKLTEYFATGDLWIFRMKNNEEGNPVRNNIAFYPSGKYESARILENKPIKEKKPNVH